MTTRGMDMLSSIQAQVRANLTKVKASPSYNGGQFWLTFYIGGPGYKDISEVLGAAGWAKAGGGADEYIYPAIQVDPCERAIMAEVQTAQSLCEKYGAQIDMIDADISPDAKQIAFISLFKLSSVGTGRAAYLERRPGFSF